MSNQKDESGDQRKSQENEATNNEVGKKVSITTLATQDRETKAEGYILGHGVPPSHAAILFHDGKPKEKRTFLQRFKGLLAIFIGTAVLALNPQLLYYQNIVYGEKYSRTNYLMWMYGLYLVENIIPVTFAAYINSDTMYKPFLKSHKLIVVFCLRGICGSFVLLLIWGAVKNFHRTAPVAIIMAMCPLFVYINAFFVLGEQIGWITVINALIAVAGVIVMNFDEGFQFDKNAWIGTLMAFAAMYLISWITVMVRILKDVHPLVVNLSFGCFGMLVQGTISYFNNTLRTFEDGLALLLCLSNATCATIGNFGYNIALKNEAAGIVALVRTTEVIFAFVYQFIFFNIPPKAANIYGALLVMFGVVSVTLRKIVKESEENSKLRKYLFFLLY